ncbi:MAG: hypothetical protein PHE43_02070 [Candidatus Nanoarchaeia archaeon]|nr:hypothetical protein [Candidatus Nanoarchaeia archaeon]
MQESFFLMIITSISLIMGYFIAYLSRDEIKSAKKYFLILKKITILIIILVSAYFFLDIYFFIGIVLGFLLKETWPYLGIIFSSSLLFENNFLFSSLIFITGIFSGILEYKNFRRIILNLILFLIPIVLYFFNINLISLAAGALIWSLK